MGGVGTRRLGWLLDGRAEENKELLGWLGIDTECQEELLGWLGVSHSELLLC